MLITYDVQTSSEGGARRLRRVSKACQNYGQRVQNSVFECIVDASQLAKLKLELIKLIDKDKDSLRIYRLGNHYKNKVEHIGAKPALDLEDPLNFLVVRTPSEHEIPGRFAPRVISGIVAVFAEFYGEIW